jgi:DNA processing protein
VSQEIRQHGSEKGLLSWLTLYFLPGLGCTLINRLVDAVGTPEAVLAAGAPELERIRGVSGRVAGLLSDRPKKVQAAQRAAEELQKLAAAEVLPVSRDSELYPEPLRHIEGCPVILFCRGDAACLQQPAIAIVGSRAATSYGRRIGFSLARELAELGMTVVSGMALGIDGEAHAGALAAGGRTIGVLGCGVDVVYPRQHGSLYRRIARQGVLVSEYPLGTVPDGFRFPERNRIISGLSLGVVVVEASGRSGSLITARLALEQGREVFAVPGRIDSAKSCGTHRLLQEGAKLVHGVEDILEELRLPDLPQGQQADRQAPHPPGGVSGEEKQLLACLEVYPVSIDQLVRHSGYDPAMVFDLLLQLELKGLVRQLPGQQYELAG